MLDKTEKCIYISTQLSMRRHYKPAHKRKTKMVSVRMTEDLFSRLVSSSEEFGLPVAVLLREGAVAYVRQLEQKDGPKKGG